MHLNSSNKNRRFSTAYIALILLVVSVFYAVFFVAPASAEEEMPVPAIQDSEIPASTLQASDIEPYDGAAIAIINDGQPDFYQSQLVRDAYVRFSPLDSLGRTGACMACLGKETLPTEARGEIGDIRPSGWHTIRYDDVIEDRYLYNRCHVIGYQLCGDNATPENLFTGTRYLNSESMLLFENTVADYLRDYPDNHVIYRVTPIYEDKNLVATGVQMEACSVEDSGTGVFFNVFVYNVQPGIRIDYATGKSGEDPAYPKGEVISAAAVLASSRDAGTKFVITAGESGGSDAAVTKQAPQEEVTAAETTSAPNYILNTNTGKFHYPTCSSVNDMKEKNKQEFYGTRDEAIAAGYVPCKRCKP